MSVHDLVTRARALARARRGGDGGGGRVGFTLTELMVVIVIIVLVLAISVPAFTSIIYSQESTLAQTRLATAMRAARDAALQSSEGTDTAAVFFFEPGGRLRIVTCMKAGELLDQAGAAGGVGGGPSTVVREVFVPMATMEPVELPRNWMVRGYVPAYTINTSGTWYEQSAGGVRYGGAAGEEPSWVFPETGFYNVLNPGPREGRKRQTFMVRFQGGSGVMSPASTSEVLVLSPRPSSQLRTFTAAQDMWKRADLATDYVRFVRRLLVAPGMTTPRTGNACQQILGDDSSDTVLARPVMMLSVYDERKLAAALGARLDRVTGCLYRSETNGLVTDPRFVDVPGRAPVEIGRLIAQWIGGNTRLDDPPGPTEPPRRDDGDQPEARIFTLDRYTGEVRQVEVEL